MFIRMRISVLILLFFLVWPCYALDTDTPINQKPADNKKGQSTKAISDYSETIRLTPKQADFRRPRGRSDPYVQHTTRDLDGFDSSTQRL